MNEFDPSPLEYHSYLLRLWRDGAQGVWRASLQSTAIGQVYHFANMEALVSFLDSHVVPGADDAARQLGAEEC